MNFVKANHSDVSEIGKLYDEVCEYLEGGENYPHWKKGVYPTEDVALCGQEEGALYALKNEGRIVGTVILRHKPEEGYKRAAWNTEDDYNKIYVIYALAVHPEYMCRGIGKRLLQEVEKIARKEGCTSLRLDVVKGNVPAERLYQNDGYKYVDTVSLGYEDCGIPWFNLYEKVLQSKR